MHTVTVVVTFALSPAKAAQVLERWWEFKAKRKAYMRGKRSGSMKKVAA